MKAKYEVLTWDSDKDKFTPQAGVRRGPYSLFGLRKALRKLQNSGYPCHRQDFFVLVQRTDDEHNWFPKRKGWVPKLGWPDRRRYLMNREALASC